MNSIYLLIRSQHELLGYIQTRMIYIKSGQTWEIVDTNSNKTLAFTNETSSFPVGVHRWFFLDGDCTDPDVPWRKLNLHMAVNQPGHFCCDNGACIRKHSE